MVSVFFYTNDDDDDDDDYLSVYVYMGRFFFYYYMERFSQTQCKHSGDDGSYVWMRTSIKASTKIIKI